MNNRREIYFIIFTLVICGLAACQKSNFTSQIATPEVPPINTQPIPTAKIVRLLTATPKAETSRTISPSQADSSTPTLLSTNGPVVQTLLQPYLANVLYSAEKTLVQIGFYFDQSLKKNAGTSGEIYDARLVDQDGRDISLVSTTILPPNLAEAEFSPLTPETKELTLHLEYVLRGLPADRPLVIDLAGHKPGESWPIRAMVEFGGGQVKLHSASLSEIESGPPGQIKKQIQLELRGNDLQWRDALLICLALNPVPQFKEFGMSCGREQGEIMTSITLGEPVAISAPLPILPATMQFQVTGDFLLDETWETSWLVK